MGGAAGACVLVLALGCASSVWKEQQLDVSPTAQPLGERTHCGRPGGRAPRHPRRSQGPRQRRSPARTHDVPLTAGRWKHVESINTPCLESHVLNVYTRELYYLTQSDREGWSVLLSPGSYSREIFVQKTVSPTAPRPQPRSQDTGQQAHRRAGRVGGLIVQLGALGHYGC